MATKEWRTFLPKPIRLRGNRKTTFKENISEVPCNARHIKEGNCLDPVIGCTGGKTNGGAGCWWGCYAKHAMKRVKKIFDEPISQVLIPELLALDLEKTEHTWVRMGLYGDPCFDWPLTLEACELIHKHKKTTVILTRMWVLPTKKHLKQLAKLNVHLHVSLCAFDSDSFLELRLDQLMRYQKYGGTARLRLVTFAFDFNEQDLWEKQTKLVHFPVDVLEQPANVRRSNPIWGRLKHESYHKHRSYDTGNFNGWYSAGPLYDLNHCDNPCWNCEHQCMTFQ